jgi:2-polyprenyl-3-methyl-5-hydroxy-6-metoxy-1,4-benzoquinol methylase
VPAPTWRLIAQDLGDIAGKSVLDIGCNAGYMSFECKKLGAAKVVGIDSSLGSGEVSFIEQAKFCREVLGLDVSFEESSLFDYRPKRPFDIVLFCGVLYHLENFTLALDRLATLVRPRAGTVVIETAIEPVTQTTPGDAAYQGDPTTNFVPSVRLLLTLLWERDFQPFLVRDLTTRAMVFTHAA